MTSFSRAHLQPAYVIHQRSFRDSSAIVDIFSEAFGRRSLVAKGIKRPKSKLRGLLQPFQPLLISWTGKSELGTLTDAELYSRPVKMNAKYIPSAFYLNELITNLIHKHDPHSDIFVSYHNTLDNLQQLSGQEDDELLWQAYLRRFEIVLMQSSGYGLVLDHDVATQKNIDANKLYDFVLDHGPINVEHVHSQVPYSEAPNLERRGIEISGTALLMLADENQMLNLSRQNDNVSRQLFKEAKRLLRTVIDYRLGHKTLHSRVLFANGISKNGSHKSLVEAK
jgi:DNA repair protein RecO (recombination protein O)